MRQAVLENVLVAVRLNPSTKEKVGIHASGMALSLRVGMLNAIAFAKFSMHVGHVSGVSFSISLRMRDEQSEDILSMEEVLLYFILGLVWVGFIIPILMMMMGQARCGLVLFGVAVLEFVCLWHPLRHSGMLAAAMGLQNAVVMYWTD